MKKRFLLILLALMCLVPSVSLAAEGPSAEAKNKVLLEAQGGVSYIPARALNGFSGIEVIWSASSKRVEFIRGAVRLSLTVGEKSASINESPFLLSNAAFVEEGTVYVPLKLALDKLELSAVWSKTPLSVILTGGEERLVLPAVTRTPSSAAKKAVKQEQKTFKVSKKSFTVQIVTVDLMHPDVRLNVVLAGDEIGKVEELSSIAKRSKAVVAINGTFFDAYTESAHKAPYGYIVTGGELKMKAGGDRRTIFTYDTNMLAGMIPGPDFNNAFEHGSIEGGIQAGPRLVKDGAVAVDVVEEGFRDPKILTGGGARSALGITKNHELLFVTSTGATIPQLAEIMKQAGAVQAMNLDGGASSGLYYNGKYLTTPGRKISNALIVTLQ